MKLRNKNLDVNSKLDYIKINQKIVVGKRHYGDLLCLRDMVKKVLGNYNKFVYNYATGYKATITRQTINKIIYPTKKFDVYSPTYIINLNVSLKLPEIFEKAIYIDSLSPMKKKSHVVEIGYHHFVSPVIMNGVHYRALITTRERKNSNILYVVSLELLKLESFDDYISVSELFNGVKIWNYDKQKYKYYYDNDIICDSFCYEISHTKKESLDTSTQLLSL